MCVIYLSIYLFIYIPTLCRTVLSNSYKVADKLYCLSCMLTCAQQTDAHQVPYVYVPSKQDLGAAGQTKRPTSIILIKKNADESYDEIKAEVSGLSA